MDSSYNIIYVIITVVGLKKGFLTNSHIFSVRETDFVKQTFFLNLFCRLFNLKDEYLAKSPYKKWLFVRNGLAFVLSTCGCNALDPHYKTSFRALINVYVFLNYFGLLIYTLYYYRDDPFRALQATAPIGFMAPVSLF